MKKFTTDHRTRVTKMLIRRAFMELLSHQPIQSISIRELCEKAGVSRGTFYSHYADIYDLLHQIESEMLEEISKALEPLLDSSSSASLVAVNRRIFEVLKANSDLCTVTLGDYGDKGFAIRLINLGRERCIDRYRIRFQNATAREIDFYYAFVSSGIIGLLRAWLDTGMTASPAEIADLAEGLMLHGLDYFENHQKESE